MEIIKKIYKQSAFVLIPLALASAFIEWKKFPLSILLGGVVGIANLKGLSWGVEGLLGTEKAASRLVFFSMIRFFIIFAVLLVLFVLKLVNVFGILIGFTVVLTILLKEGFRAAKNEN